MLWNYIKIALRNLRKNKVFAAINIFGLAFGMTIFVFGGLLVRYESTHDAFFANSDRIYTIGSMASPNLNVGIRQIDATWTAVGPFIKAEIDGVEDMARTVTREHLVSIGDNRFYEKLRAADPAFLKIFDLDFIHGDSTALDDPSGLIMSESAAIKYFGNTDVLGKVVTLDNTYDFRVSGVFKDVPKNSHFNSMPVMDTSLDIVMPMAALGRMDEDFDINGKWDNLSLGNMTYVMLRPGLDGKWLNDQLVGIYDRHFPEQAKDGISSIYASPLQHANLGIWDTFGLPAVAIIRLLSFLVLVVACVNYTNLATAQALGRSREVGMRKTMGAQRGQLLLQFLIESVVIATIAMLVAVAILEIVIPLFDNLSNKVMRLDYLRTLPWLATGL